MPTQPSDQPDPPIDPNEDHPCEDRPTPVTPVAPKRPVPINGDTIIIDNDPEEAE